MLCVGTVIEYKLHLTLQKVQQIVDSTHERKLKRRFGSLKKNHVHDSG